MVLGRQCKVTVDLPVAEEIVVVVLVVVVVVVACVVVCLAENSSETPKGGYPQLTHWG